MFSKRAFIHLLPLALLIVMLLAACGGGSSPSGSSNSNNIDYSGTITIWHNWQGDYINAKKAIFDAYTKLHPKVAIKLVHQDDVIAKSIIAIKANNGPDIIDYADDNLGKLASSHAVIPLDDYISKGFVNSTYSKPAADAVTFNDKIYGVPETVEALTLIYNKDLVSPNDVPKTSDDLLNFAKTFQQQHPGKYGVVWDILNGYTAAPFFYGYGASFVTPDGKAHLDTPKALAAMNYINSFRPYLPKQITYDAASSLFTEGKAAIMLNGPWAYADYAKANLKLGFAQLPIITATNTPAKPFVGVKSLWVTKNAKNVALCTDLIKFFTNKENQVNMVKTTGEIPANLAAQDDSTIKDNPVITAYASQVKLGTALPNTPYMSALWTPLQQSLTAMWNGSQKPEAALASAQSAATKGIAQITS